MHLMILALTISLSLAAATLLDKIKDDPDLSQVINNIQFQVRYYNTVFLLFFLGIICVSV